MTTGIEEKIEEEEKKSDDCGPETLEKMMPKAPSATPSIPEVGDCGR
jgi:hypothetical protein